MIDPKFAATVASATLKTGHVIARDKAKPAAVRRYLSLDDFERAGRRHLPAMLSGFIAGGTETEVALRGNRASFGAYSLVPRVLVDSHDRSTTTTLFKRVYAAPFGIAPMGVSALCAYRGDLALAAAAAAANIPMVLSASSLIPMETVRQSGAHWFQAYLPGDPARIDALVDRVARAGFETLVVTVDIPVAANRENNVRNGFSVPLEPTLRLALDGIKHPSWLFGTALRTLVQHGMPHFENMDAGRGPAILARDVVRAVGPRDRLTWVHLAAIRKRWPGPLVIKGVLSAADAVIARETGINGIIISNHGGRQLDAAIAPLTALPAIAAAVPGMTLMLDGGIRRGTDVLKALALGAHFVFVGRPFLYAAAVGGEALVQHAAQLLADEVHRNMALLGIRRLSELSTAHLGAAARLMEQI
jgi:L-lactate dehydrogenase (cytochrome)